MAFRTDPGIYTFPAGSACGWKDDMHITVDGARWFTPQSPSIEQPFG